ncbi:hypothetical protein F4780DRAFT_709692 [Xylariomycetidae sp. FL0641]|nr:hypothetical protein F4780DRAFT_709692 [Xylariomycetidae sp. FL0641]
MEQQPPEQFRSELESFRAQWRAEVSARNRNTTTDSQLHQEHPRPTHQVTSSTAPHRPRRSDGASHRKTGSRGHLDQDDEYVPAPSFDEPDSSKSRGGQRLDGEDAITQAKEKEQEPKTALDFYEHAVERETTGKLGDSLELYRKAFRMDDRVDRTYRDKYFAHRWNKPAPSGKSNQTPDPNPSNAPVTVPNTAHHSLQGPEPGPATTADAPTPLPLPELIASFANMKVEGAPPECEGAPPPPCPIAELPDEILVHILRDVAVADVGDFVRLSQVCRRLAYLVATEDRIWRRVCLGPEFGFGGMHYHWTQSNTEWWQPLSTGQLLLAEGGDGDVLAMPGSSEGEGDLPDTTAWTAEEVQRRRAAASEAATCALYAGRHFGASWGALWRRRPRVRFNGCYISTVNYIRAGAHSGQHVTWGGPVHIVTYYRYLRLFRDGAAISLTTTDEPAHVVHHLTKDALATHRRAKESHLPSAVMAHALRGRWRLGCAALNPADADVEEAANSKDPVESEGNLLVETEGVGPKYMYRMELALRSAGKAVARNNKLVWKGFWSYNRLTDDWAEFALRNDKPFFFSRVKSYGLGE